MGRRQRRLGWWWLALVALAALAGANAPGLVRAFWSFRSTNPVRRGIARAQELGCFSCHGFQGTRGLPDPGAAWAEVPAWNGGSWMMYVEADEEIGEYILNGISERRRRSAAAAAEREALAIRMPAFATQLRRGDLVDLVAAFKVLAEMNLPPEASAARRGQELARRWRCLACHGAAGSGGLPNPGSLTGFIPGWYGADFADLVHHRAEFDEWLREGSLERLRASPLAAFFLRRQRIAMPAYRELAPAELDDLWAYVGWLAETGGGWQGGVRPF